MIIVTGGAGFIGSNIVQALNNIQYNTILIVDDLKNGKKCENLIDLDIVDFLDKQTFFNKFILNNDCFLKKIDVIFHEGACSSTTEWNGNYVIENNYQYSKELLHFALKHKIPFLYASSASVYGKNVKGFIEERQYERPCNIYGYSKFLFDQYVRSILPEVTSPICGLRYFNVYGPKESHKKNMASIVFNLSKRVLEGKNPQLFIGSKIFRRDFIHVEDIVNINIWAWQKGISGIFNCGLGQSISFQDIADIVLNFYKKGIIEYVPFPKQLIKYYQTFTQANITKLRCAGYDRPFKNINNGIKEYLSWLSNNL